MEIRKMNTNDFYLASFLVATGIELQGHQKIEDKTKFWFENNPKTELKIKQYYSMNGSVEPVAYANAIKNLKSIIHSCAYTNSNNEEKQYVKHNSGKK